MSKIENLNKNFRSYDHDVYENISFEHAAQRILQVVLDAKSMNEPYIQAIGYAIAGQTHIIDRKEDWMQKRLILETATEQLNIDKQAILENEDPAKELELQTKVLDSTQAELDAHSATLTAGNLYINAQNNLKSEVMALWQP